jgi:hypothetical protein
MDIAIAHSSQREMASALDGWDIHVAADGALIPNPADHFFAC